MVGACALDLWYLQSSIKFVKNLRLLTKHLQFLLFMMTIRYKRHPPYISKWSPLLQLILTTSFWNTLHSIGLVLMKYEITRLFMIRFCNASNSCRLFCHILDLVVNNNYNNFWTIALHTKSWHLPQNVQIVLKLL